MDVVVRGPGLELRTTLPLTLWPSGGSYRLEGGDRRNVELDALGEGELMTAHLATPEGFEDDAAFAVTRRDGVVRLRKASGESDLVNRPGWGPMLAFAPWKAVVTDEGRVIESWPAATRHEAEGTASLRAAEHARERGRWQKPVECTVSETARIPAADLIVADQPSPGL